MSIRRFSLWVFFIVWLSNGLGLMLDGILKTRGIRTITEQGEQSPWIPTIILVWNLIGIQALMVHFFFLRGGGQS